MIRFTQGDMFETPADIRVNTVNCVGVMGAGVALAFKNRYPAMFREYKRECAAGRMQPGFMHVWRELDQWIINFPTKRHWKDKSRYDDVEAGLVALREYLFKLGPVKVALPALGCGHGGLDWKKVSAMIREHLEGLDAEIIVFDPADSHTVAKKSHSSPSTNWRTVRADEALFPGMLARVGVKELSYSGEVKEDGWESDVAIFVSSKPNEKEMQTAIACVGTLVQPGMKVGLVIGTKVSGEVAKLVLEKGGLIVGWVPQGLDQFSVPQYLAASFAENKIRLISVAKPHQKWNPGFASQSAVSALTLAKASLFVDPAPQWLSKLHGLDLSRLDLFYIRYQSASSEQSAYWQDLNAKSIGRRNSDGRPNMEPILQVIADQHVAPNPVDEIADNQSPSVLREGPVEYRQNEEPPVTLPPATENSDCATPASKLLNAISLILTDSMVEPMSANEVASLLGVSKTQVQSWLEELMRQNVVEKLKKPVRYRARKVANYLL